MSNKVIHWHVRERQAWGEPRGGSLVQAVWRRLAEQTPSVACASFEMAYVSYDVAFARDEPMLTPTKSPRVVAWCSVLGARCTRTPSP